MHTYCWRLVFDVRIIFDVLTYTCDMKIPLELERLLYVQHNEQRERASVAATHENAHPYHKVMSGCHREYYCSNSRSMPESICSAMAVMITANRAAVVQLSGLDTCTQTQCSSDQTQQKT